MKTRVLFMGTPDFACGILQALTELPFVELAGVLSQPDKKVGRQQKLQPTPVHALAQQLALPVLQPEKIRTEYAEVLALNPELIVTCAYGQMVPEAVLRNTAASTFMLRCCRNTAAARRSIPRSFRAKRKAA